MKTIKFSKKQKEILEKLEAFTTEGDTALFCPIQLNKERILESMHLDIIFSSTNSEAFKSAVYTEISIYEDQLRKRIDEVITSKLKSLIK